MTITPYAPPRSERPIDLKLDANEGRQPPASLLLSLAGAGTEVLRRYPSTLGLERLLADRLGVSSEQVVVTGGGDDALDRICRAFLTPGRRAVMSTPTFEMIPRGARATGAEVIEIPWSGGPFPTGEFIRLLDARTGVAFVVTPNNPTGAVASADDIRAISAAAGDRPVCVDLAYTEYADVDLTPVALSLPNVVIVRTFSKAWSLAGLRVGYAMGPTEIVRLVRNAGGPYPVAGPALALAADWLSRGEGFVRESVAIVRAERVTLASVLRSFGAQVVDSQANFVFARFDDAWGVADRLAESGVGVRRFPRPGPLADALRLTCPGDAASFDRLLNAIRSALEQETRP